MNDSVFTHTQDQLKQLAQDVLAIARETGASDAAVEISEGSGLAVTVRKGKIETIEQNKDKGIGVTVYWASAAATPAPRISPRHRCAPPWRRPTTSPASPPRTRPPACRTPSCWNRTRATCASCYPWQISTEEAVEIAQRCEAAAFAVDPRMTNSEGASVYVQQSHFVAANSLGFCAGYPFSRHTLSVAPIAGKGAKMQRDDWYSSARDPKKAGRPGEDRPLRRRARAGAPERAQARYPHLPGAVRGAAGRRPARRLRAGDLGRRAVPQVELPARFAGQSIFPSHIQVMEDPHVVGGVGSAPFDEEGVRTQRRKSSATACCRVISCRLIRRASWACRPPATPAARTTWK
jgi:PmbA protein